MLLHLTELVLQVLDLHVFVASSLQNLRFELLLNASHASIRPLFLFSDAAFKLLLLDFVEVFHLGKLLFFLLLYL